MSSEEYDVVVDEAPASPNTKARVAAVLMPLVQQLLQAQLISPTVLADLVQFLDIPASVAQTLAQAITQQVQVNSQPNPAVVAQQQADLENKQADTAEKKAKAQGHQAKSFAQVTDAHVTHVGLAEKFMGVTNPPGPPAPPPGQPAPPPGGGTPPPGPGLGAAMGNAARQPNIGRPGPPQAAAPVRGQVNPAPPSGGPPGGASGGPGGA